MEIEQPEVLEAFREKLKLKAEEIMNGEVESVWSGRRDGVLQAADAVCGRTKGPPRHKVA